VGEGFHTRFGAPHAEVEALAVAGGRAQGATAFVTLEPCCHQGKTPPCSQALVRAGVARVVVAQPDPFPRVAGGGIAELKAAGIEVEVGLLEAEARKLNAPYLKLVTRKRPWLIAKWAMTLDGKLATRTSDSRWVSGKESRAVVHALRGRVDAILIGSGTATADDPRLTARPPGPRTAARIVVDSRASLPPTSQLARTIGEAPVIVAAAADAPAENRRALEAIGCEVLSCPGGSPAARLSWLLDELGRRQMTNVLVESGGKLMGSLFDLGEIDEVHAFIAPKLVGGTHTAGPVGGSGLARMAEAWRLDEPTIEVRGQDVSIHGRVKRQ
jgi:diaminohydroxyphosphoribosylaminopyrimidine deaminase/5-amino-6-(5-phosphoribosylamino)uracil reductase